MSRENPTSLENRLRLAPLRLRLLSMAYEGVLLFGILFIAAYLFIALARDAQSGLPRLLFQVYVLAVCGTYFVFCWVRSGQTLPMKTWRIRLVTEQGKPLTLGRAVLRYLLAVPGMVSGIGVLWAFVDRDRQFLHDRLAKTRIVRVEQQKGAD
ncbi:MAG TPA: RDD family protein [Burkholderiales bacterium]|nr:RDD family protein [Burkholderiales bacterium]